MKNIFYSFSLMLGLLILSAANSFAQIAGPSQFRQDKSTPMHFPTQAVINTTGMQKAVQLYPGQVLLKYKLYGIPLAQEH